MRNDARVPFIGLPRQRGPYAAAIHEFTAANARVALWYPAARGARGNFARYRAGEPAPSWRTPLLRASVRTGARPDAPAAPGAHPLLLYFASWGGGRGENTALAENLARHGFAVAALDDAGAAPPMNFSTPAASAATERHADQKLLLAAGRGRAVLDALLSRSAAGTLPVALAPSRAGAIGFSFGGAVAAELARTDERIRAAVNLDGWMFGAAAHNGIAKPLLVIGTGLPDLRGGSRRSAHAHAAGSLEADFNARNERALIAAMTRRGGCFVAVDGSRHLGFCDAGVLPARPSHAGPIGGRRLSRIVFAYTRAFVDSYVAGWPTPLLDETPVAPCDPAIVHIVWLPPPHADGAGVNGPN